MEYSERVRRIAVFVLHLTESEGKTFSNAFSEAFRKSDFDSDLYHMVRIGVKSFHRSWKNEKMRALAGSRGMANQAHENICPLA